MLAEIIFFALLGYFIYKVVFDVSVPVSHAARQMKQQFRDIHQQGQRQAGAYQQQQPADARPPRPETPRPKHPSDEYIDFEEVK